MDEVGLAVVLMIVGAFLGSIISPASEMFFSNFFAKKGNRYSIGNGLILLCAANASWVVSFLLFETSKSCGKRDALLKFNYCGKYLILIY